LLENFETEKIAEIVKHDKEELEKGDPVIIIGDSDEKLAAGSLINLDKNSLLHGVKIGEGNVAVTVSSIYVAAKRNGHLLKFLIPQHEELTRVDEARGHVIRWPFNQLQKNTRLLNYKEI